MLPLMVIDLQPGFLDSSSVCNKHLTKCLKNARHQIKRAMRREAPVLLVEFAGNGATKKELTDLLEGYKNQIRVWKWDNDVTFSPSLRNDGRMKVPKILKKCRALRVCGINTNACVRESVHGLLQRFEDLKIEVVKSACANVWSRSGHGNFWWCRARYYHHANRIKLV